LVALISTTHTATTAAQRWWASLTPTLCRVGHPALTKEEFVRNDLKGAVGEITEDLIRQQLEYLEQGEKLLAGSERR
jgi:hypothetical protein